MMGDRVLTALFKVALDSDVHGVLRMMVYSSMSPLFRSFELCTGRGAAKVRKRNHASHANLKSHKLGAKIEMHTQNWG